MVLLVELLPEVIPGEGEMLHDGCRWGRALYAAVDEVKDWGSPYFYLD